MKQLGISLIGLIVFLFVCCKPQQQSQNVVILEKDQRPSWLVDRPIDNSFYIGISGTSKLNNEFDYASNSKSKALEDLSSEIRVKVESNSVLFQLERNDSFRDSYESVIKSKVSQEIEGFELVDAWETDTEYWVYYRLSKAKFRDEQLSKQRTAQNLSLDLFKKGKDFEKNGDVLTALSSYLNSLKALHDYLGDLNEVEYEGRTIYMGTEIYNSVQVLMKKIKISSISSIDYKRGVTRNKNIKVIVYCNGEPLANVPLVAYFTSGVGELSKGVQSNGNGKAAFVLSSVSSPSSSQEIVLGIDLEKIRTEDKLYGAMLESVQLPRHVISLNVSGPTVYLSSSEKILGKPSTSVTLKDYIIKKIVNNGFSITDSKSSADLICFISADTKKGTENSGVFVSYMTASFIIKNSKTNKVIYAGKLIDVKGVQLDFEKAGADAYKKSFKKIDKEILPEMQRVVFE
jgi:hypothetical protein